MSKPLITLILVAAAGFAQTQKDPSDDTKKTPEEKGYHITKPKNTGPTPPETKEQKQKEKDLKDKRDRENGLEDGAPPTLQPDVKPPKS